MSLIIKVTEQEVYEEDGEITLDLEGKIEVSDLDKIRVHAYFHREHTITYGVYDIAIIKLNIGGNESYYTRLKMSSLWHGFDEGDDHDI